MGVQLLIELDEPAEAWVERHLARTCPVHIETTLDEIDGTCPMCDLDAAEHTPVPAWVARARAGELPTKVYQG